MDYLSNDEKDQPNQDENSCNLCDKTGHLVLSKAESKCKLRQPQDSNFPMEGKLSHAEKVDSTSLEYWHIDHKENYAAKLRVRTLFRSLQCKGTEPSSVREKDIYQILVLNEITDVEALYKISGQRFVLIFGSEDSALKCESTELAVVSGDERISLLLGRSDLRFRKPKRAPTFATIFLPECISCRAVELAFSNFEDVYRLFYDTQKFNRNLRSGKQHIGIFPSGGDLKTLAQKITFSDGVPQDVLYKGKIVNCYRYNTRHGLGNDCAKVVSNDSDVPLSEQNNSSRDNTPRPPPSLSPDEISTTDGTPTVVDDHRQDKVKSNDPASNLQESDQDPLRWI